jgi:hypothetical protein
VIGLLVAPVGNDKKVHFLLFGGLGTLVYLSLSLFDTPQIKNNAAILAISIAALFAITDEIHQLFVSGRTCSIYDWYADVAGIIFAVMFLRMRRNIPKISKVAVISIFAIMLMCGSASADDGLHLQSSGQFYLQYNPIDLMDIDSLVFESDGSTQLSPNNYTFQNGSNSVIISNCTSVRPLYSGIFTNFSGNTLYFVNPADDRIDLMGGNWNITGATLIGDGNIEIKKIQNGGNIENVYMNGIYNLYISQYNNGGIIRNIQIINSVNGFDTYSTGGLDNYLIENISIVGNTGYNFRLQNSSQTIVRNVTVDNDIDFNQYQTLLGLGAWKSDHMYFYDVNVDETFDSAFRLNVVEDSYCENITVNHAGHNGYDLEGSNITIVNGAVNGSVSNAIHISGSNYVPETYYDNVTHDITLRNIDVTYTTVEPDNSVGGATGGGIYFNNCWNITMDNVTSRLRGGGFTTTYSMDCNIFNCSVTDNTDSAGDLYLGSGNAEADRAIRTTVSNSDFQRIYIVNSEETKFINVNGSRYISLGADDYKEWTNYVPLNVRVLNITSVPVSGATLTFECSNTSYQAVDMEGKNITSVLTGSDGRPIETVYVPESYYDAVTTSLRTSLTFTNNITATKSEETDCEVIDPSPSDYSANLSDMSMSLVTLTLDVEGSGEPMLAISDFTPTDTTPSSVDGTEQTFSIDLTKTANVTWYIDSNEVQTNTSVTTASYSNSTAPVGTYNVTVIATDGVTEVNQTWIWTVVDITEYWTPTPGTHYIGVPETHSWIGGEWVVTYSGTYTEAQTEVTGVEIRP